VRKAARLLEADDAIVIAEVDDPEGRPRPGDDDRRCPSSFEVPLKERDEIGVDELVAVQGVEISRLLPRRGGKANATPPPERLPLRHGHDLGPQTGKLGLEEIFLAGGAADEDTLDSGVDEKRDLMRGQGASGDLDQRLRSPSRSLAEAFGLPTGQDDGFHERGYSSGKGFRPLAIASMVSFESLLRSVLTTQ
jgi:hypothetical protein